MNQRREFLKQVGAVFAGVAAAVYCPAVLGELFKPKDEYMRFGMVVDPGKARQCGMSQTMMELLEFRRREFSEMSGNVTMFTGLAG